MSSIAATTYDGAYAVTKSDTVDDPNGGPAGFAGLLVVATGTLSFVDALGNTVAITLVPAFALIPVRCVRVNTTGTSATVFGLRAVP